MSKRWRLVFGIMALASIVVLGWTVIGPPLVERHLLSEMSGVRVECRTFGLPMLWIGGSEASSFRAEAGGKESPTDEQMTVAQSEAETDCRNRGIALSTTGILLGVGAVVGGTLVAKSRRASEMPR